MRRGNRPRDGGSKSLMTQFPLDRKQTSGEIVSRSSAQRCILGTTKIICPMTRLAKLLEFLHYQTMARCLQS